MNAIAGANLGRSHRRISSSMPASPVQKSLLAIRQEAVRIATPRGLLDAQLVKILRIEHRPMPGRQYPNVPVARTRWLPPASHRSITKPPDVPKATSEIVRPAPQQKRTEVGLRTVGEVLTDNDGHLYELRGQQLHMLGQLVRDERGRFFEVCHSTSAGVSKGEENEHSNCGTGAAADVQNLRAESVSDNQLSETATQPTNRELQDSDGNTLAEPSSIGHRKPSSILAKLAHWIFSDRPRRLTALTDRKT